MNLRIYNTKTRKVENFIPHKQGEVGMYVCGPTVYDTPHIGNSRSNVVYDILYRVLCHIYGKDCVKYVRNITDVDDKIIDRAASLSISIRDLTTQTEKQFHDTLNYLGCLSPTVEPRATESIDDMIMIIEKLIDLGHAYEAEKHVYFRVESYKEYGELSGRNLEDMIAGSRIEVELAKEHPGDFVLWKPDNNEVCSFDSPWGKGRPGWHIECSAMSYRHLGADFDIHGGGADLIFPHHTNEIAQSCCAFPGSNHARFWIHNGFLTVGGEKMSKSLGNFITVEQLRQQGVKGEVIRYMLMSTHYRKPFDYKEETLHEAIEIMDYLYRACSNVEISKSSREFIAKEVLEYLLDDMNTHGALSELYKIAKKINSTEDLEEKTKLQISLKASGLLLGLLQQDANSWFKSLSTVDEVYINQMLEKRAEARLEKNWALSDSIRDELKSKGIIIEDLPGGKVEWRAE